jgi:hypothetical protein
VCWFVSFFHAPPPFIPGSSAKMRDGPHGEKLAWQCMEPVHGTALHASARSSLYCRCPGLATSAHCATMLSACAKEVYTFLKQKSV